MGLHPPFRGSMLLSIAFVAFAETPTEPDVLPAMDIVGTVDPQAVHAAVLASMPLLMKCYGFRGITGRTGVVVVKFLVDKKGKVTNSSLKRSELGDIEVESCLVDTFRQLEVPATKGEGISIVSYPFVPHEEGRPARPTE